MQVGDLLYALRELGLWSCLVAFEHILLSSVDKVVEGADEPFPSYVGEDEGGGHSSDREEDEDDGDEDEALLGAHWEGQAVKNEGWEEEEEEDDIDSGEGSITDDTSWFQGELVISGAGMRRRRAELR